MSNLAPRLTTLRRIIDDRHSLVIFLLPLLLTLLVASCAPNTRAPKRATMQRLKEVQYAIGVLEDVNHTAIAEQLRGVARGTTLQDKWEILLVDNAGKLEWKTDTRQSLCLDYWGNRFNVEFKTNLNADKISTALTQSPFDVIIWSSGANGTNEFGNGDDVVLPLPATKK